MRWIHLPGLSMQPSEFIKPLFAVTAAWLFSRQCERKGFPALSVNVALYATDRHASLSCSLISA